VGWRVVILQKSALYTPFVWVFSSDILPQAAQDIVNRTLSAVMDESTDFFFLSFFTFSSVGLHDGRHKF
jgi:hypothetical protein